MKENNLKHDILNSLHQQYAENVNKRQGLFVQLLVALFALFGAYGYVWIHTRCLQNGVDVIKCNGVEYFSFQVLIGVSIITELILLLLSVMLISFGYASRRDQFIVRNIENMLLTQIN